MLVNLGKLLDENQPADAVAIIDCLDFEHPRAYTHGDIDRLADACARGLLAQGLTRGDTVALMSLNRAEYVIAYLAIMRAGLVAVPINYKLAGDTLALILADCQAKLVFVDEARQALLPPGMPAQRLDGPAWDTFLDPGPFTPVTPDDDACAMVLYTSGSTGRPKGVQLSHQGQLWTLRSRLATRASFLDERFIVAAPLFHMNALASVKFALAGHASIVLLPQFDARQFIRAIGRHGVTWVTSVPTMMAMVVKEQDALRAIDTSRVHYVRMGSAAASAKLYQTVKEAFPNASLAGGYGTTEAGPIVFGPVPGHALPSDGGLGWPLRHPGRRTLDADTGQYAGLPEPAGKDGRSPDRRRLVQIGRRVPAQYRRVLLLRGPGRRHVQLRRRKYLPRRGRASHCQNPRSHAGLRDPRARRAQRA